MNPIPIILNTSPKNHGLVGDLHMEASVLGDTSGRMRCSARSWLRRVVGQLAFLGPEMRDLPSGYVKIAIENGHRNSGFSH